MSRVPVYFHCEGISYVLKHKNHIRNWVTGIIQQHNKKTGEINYVITSDKYLHQLNLKHLNHNTLTDIITFDYSDKKTISGDIFISLERVKENASELSVNQNDELHRVMIHGVLHLLGYKDKTKEQKKEMRAKEDESLSLRSF